MTTNNRTVAIAVVAGLVLAGCVSHTSPQTATTTTTTTTRLQGPRSQVVNGLELPPDAERIISQDFWEVWRVMWATPLVRNYLEPQLPISRNYENLPWCKTITTGPDNTTWLWGPAGYGGYQGLSIKVSTDKDPDYTRVDILKGAGEAATDCEVK